MNNYEKLDLYEHNIDAYEKVKEVYDNGGDVASVIQATGTGKSYISFALALDNKEKKILYVVPTNGIKEHLLESINSNPNLSLEEDFPNLNIITYQSLVNMTKQELANLECDMLITDEIQHFRGPVWEARIKTIIDTHPNLIRFGMTAYTVVDRGTSYERDVTNPLTDEIFSNSVVSYYDLCDAIIDGVLPKPIYKTVITENNEDLKEIEKLVNRLKEKNDSNYKDYEKILLNIKRMIHTSDGVKELIRKSVKPDGKYIYFCPVNSSEGKNDIDTIMNDLKEYFIKYMDEENLVFYKSTSSDGKIGKLNRDSFYNDLDLDGNKVDDKLRIIFVKNQYNEGSHAPNIDGVFLGRHTNSDIVAFEQIGRGLSVRGDTKKRILEYQKYSIEELRSIALSREIPINENASKEEIIEKLVAPIIIDLCDNIQFIKELEDNLKDRIREIKELGNRTKRKIKITDYSFDIEVINIEILNILSELKTRLARKFWNEMYELARIYYEYYGDSEIPVRFKTINGKNYEENGFSLGRWIVNQRTNYDKLSKEQKEKLDLIEFRIQKKYVITNWDEMYELAKIYYDYYGDSEIQQKFKTKNGIDYDEDGVNLGRWITRQRIIYFNLSKEQQQKLDLIKFRISNVRTRMNWDEWYNLAEIYYEHHGHSKILGSFKTKNGIDYDEDGVNLGIWLINQRKNYDKLSEEKKEKLDLIEFKTKTNNKNFWNERYNLSKVYYKYYGNSEIPAKFKTKNGIDYAEDGVNLGSWISQQRIKYSKLSKEQKEKLDLIEFRVENKKTRMDWDEWYSLAKIYYEHHDNSEIPTNFKTKNGIDYDEDGVNLGDWLRNQRRNYFKLSEEQKGKLELIEFRVQNKLTIMKWDEWYSIAKAYYEYYGHCEIPVKFKTKNGIDYDEDGVNLGSWISNQRTEYFKLSKEKQKQLDLIEFRIEPKYTRMDWDEWYSLAKIYYEHHGNSEIRQKFKTKNGFEYDEDGIRLGAWIFAQREKYSKLTKDQKEKLDLIEFKESIRKTKEKLIKICEQYELDYDKNKFLIENISYQEMVAKINYLIEQKRIQDEQTSIKEDIYEFINRNIKIFEMTSANMKLILGIDKQELIQNYYINYNKRNLK